MSARPLPALVPLLMLPAGLALLAAPAAADPAADVRISEVECGGEGPDWVELVNTGTEPADLGGWYLRDDEDGRDWRIPEGTVLDPGALLVLTGEETEGDGGFDFALGSVDQVRLFLPDGETAVDAVGWSAHAHTTYVVVDGALVESAEATPGAPNALPDHDPAPAEPSPTPTPDLGPALEARTVVINEVSAPGEHESWAELKNTGEVAVDLTDWTLRGTQPQAEAVTLAAGTAIAPGERIVVAAPGDGVRLHAPDGALVDEVLPPDAVAPAVSGEDASLQRCPDGAGGLAGARSTPGSANSCAAPVTIHEVGAEEDFVELRNDGAVAVDLGGYVVKDARDDHAHTIPAGTTVPAGGLLLIPAEELGFALEDEDAVRLFSPEGERIGEVSWIGRGEPSFGQCEGVLSAQEQATPGEENACPPTPQAEPAAAEALPAEATATVPAAAATGTAAPAAPLPAPPSTGPPSTAPPPAEGTPGALPTAEEPAEDPGRAPLAATGAEIPVAAALAVLCLAAGYRLVRRASRR